MNEKIKMERPILFSTEMIQAILDGRKTQTRRIIKTKSNKAANFKVCKRVIDNSVYEIIEIDEDENEIGKLDCPYGKIGDILWVRETWRPCRDQFGQWIDYKADFPKTHSTFQWKPSIFMPKEACRLKLKITDVKVQRVKNIGTFELLREGMTTNLREYDAEIDLYNQFKNLWDKLNSKRGYSWESNPFVWIISFQIIKP